MAQADNKKGFWPLNSNHEKKDFPVATTQTLAAGDAVVLSGNQVIIATNSTVPILGVMAAPSVLAVAGTLVAVYVAEGGDFEGRFDASTSYACGDDCDITGSTGAMQIDADATSNNAIRLIRRRVGDSAGAGDRWQFRFNLTQFAQARS